MRSLLSPLVVLTLGCGPDAAEHAPSAPHVGGEVVAVVRIGDAASAVLGSEVGAYAAARSLGVRAALDELVDEHLLAVEAMRRDLAPGDLERRREQVLAQLLLRSLEAETPAASILEDEVTARLSSVEAALRRPERRAAVHLLVRVEGGGESADEQRARDAAARAVQLARTEREAGFDPQSALERVRERLSAESSGLDILVERIPLFEVTAGYDRPFVQAVYRADSVGILAEPVRTRFGYHVVDVLQIEPAYVPTADEIERRARADLVEERRRAALQRLLARARDAAGVEIREAAVSRLFGDDSLFVERP